MTLRLRVALAAVLVIPFAVIPLAAQDSTASAADSVQAKQRMAEPFRWKTAGSRYTDPTSFFSLHGYVDAVFAGRSRDWTALDAASPGMPGQVLIPNTPVASFQYDAALFVGAELNKRTRLMMEWHLVSDPSGRGAAGPGGNTIVMTEATATWDLVPAYLSMSAGLYWAPFASVNRDWLGAQNLFTMVPVASAAFPAHFNERGVRFDGARALNSETAINYVVSVGNGVNNFDISGQTAFSTRPGMTTVGRVGLFPGLGQSLEVGASFVSGALRDSLDRTRSASDPERYGADLRGLGLDANLAVGGFRARTYALATSESFDAEGRASAVPGALARRGAMVEAGYDISTPKWPLGISKVTPKLRMDASSIELLDASSAGKSVARSRVFSLGASIFAGENLYLSSEYHLRREGDRARLDNDRFVLRLTAEF